ncbi:MAG: glutamate synthase subunit alpha, partial [Actinobacteria bacterium]|nr:glutamate synthase subunit alpha [Actinomycetota bacterium]
LKTGRDVVIAALLGAEEFGFATAPLVVSGCIMMRVCHLDTCPVGVATQNPELRKKFSGKPEFVVTFMEYIAEEVREHMAALGFRTMQEMIGHVEVLDTRSAITHWKAKGLDISPILAVPSNPYGSTLFHSVAQDHGLDDALDQLLLRKCAPAIERAEAVTLDLPIRNVNRTVGTMLGSAITKAHGGAGLPDGTISLNFRGSAGQSFGAFVPAGVTMTLEGDANDYVGKGLSGGRVVVRPDRAASFAAEDNVIAGNVIGYGATSGEMYLRGLVGERFCVRNSGATAVVEGVGDHGCEYMTGGRVVVLGPTGRNFGAGMSGGIAYVYDPLDMFEAKLNRDMVQLQQLDDVDRSFVLATVGRHAALTGSPVAQRIVADWVGEAGHFKRVMPVDYERVLGVMARAEADGLDEAATLDRVMEASRG